MRLINILILSWRLFKLFGYDNKNISPKDLRDEIINTLDIIKTEPSENVYEVDDADKPGLTTTAPLKDGNVEYDQVDNSLHISKSFIFSTKRRF